jgi:BlaI family transcriptional regulator, penicillinase repressor
MAETAKDVTDAELGVMRLLWDRKESTIRELTDTLYPGGSTSHYATVQKLLERLENKGFAKRDAGSTPHKFYVRIGRDALVGRRLTAMADKLCGGSLTPLLTHLIQSRRLTTKEIGILRELIDRNGKPARRRKPE